MKGMDRRTAICEFLRRYHVGEDNAVSSKELERLFLMDGRTVRRKVSSLRQDGFPICSGTTGYYYAASQKEINETVCRLNSLVTRISNARTGLLYSSVLSCEDMTIEVNITL